MPLMGRDFVQDFNNFTHHWFPGSQNAKPSAPPPPPKPQPSFQDVANMTAKQVANYEGFRSTAYKPVPSDPWTIGYGSTRHPGGTPVKPGETIDRAKAQKYLTERVKQDANFVKSVVKVPLHPNQLSALSSLAYNIGHGAFQKSTILRKLNAGKYGEAAGHFMDWTRDGSGKQLGGLVKRRAQEQLLFKKSNIR